MMHSITAPEATLDGNNSNHATTIGMEMLADGPKSDSVINEHIDRFLPTEVSSTESEDGEGDLLDDIEDEDAGGDEMSRSQDDSKNFRGRPSSCVFVASLAASLSDDELCLSVTNSFKQYGELARVKVLRDHANRPYAFVQYKNDKDAKMALKMAQGSMLNGRTLRCESARVNRTLFITHQDSLEFNKIMELCEKFGELEQLVPNKEQNQFHRNNRKYHYPTSNGCSWFVQFAYRDDAIRAFANLRGEPEWDVEWVQNIEVPKYLNLLNKRDSIDDIYRKGSKNHDQEDDYDSHNDEGDIDEPKSDSEVEPHNFETIDRKSIFIGQLDPSVTKEKLNDRFSNHGEIVDINLISKSTNIFAFIQFDTEEAAAAALERENHAIFLSKTMHVQYKIIGGHHGKRHGRRNNGNGYRDKNGSNFNGPQVNLAPPPINMYRRRSYEPEPMLPYISQAMPSHSDFEINPYNNPYMRNALRRTSLPNGWSSTRSYSFKSESENNFGGDGVTDATSDVSASAGKANSTTTYNNSSAGSIGQTNSIESKNYANKSKKKFMKRGSFNEPPKPYYFQPYYYHPMHYPMGPMGPSHPSQAPGGNQPYMMVYPLPPPPATGVDGHMMAPGLPMCQPDPRMHGSQAANQPHFGHIESNDFSASKPYNLDY